MVQDEPAWTYEHSIDCKVTVEFAWDFWTNVKHWALDADVESVGIDGPFAAGLSGAVGRCVWTFADTSVCTRITQRWTLQGEQADSYAKAVAPGLEAGILAGMKKLCTAMEDAAKFDHSSTSDG
jgi:hypothetical protein